MKYQARLILTLLFVIAGTGLLSNAASAAEAAGVQVILVEASNPSDGKGGVDPALREYASTLQRLFRFNSYKQLARRGIRMQVPGEGGTGLPGGQKLVLKATEGGGSGLMAELSWTRGGKRLLHTRIQLRPGQPAVLGGPRSNGGTHLLILTLE